MDRVPEDAGEPKTNKEEHLAEETAESGDQPETADRPMAASEPIIQDEDERLVDEVEQEVPLPPPTNLTPDGAAIIGLYVTPQRVGLLHNRIDSAMEQVKDLVNNLSLAATLFDRLESARQLMFSALDNYDESERLVVEVEHRMEFMRRVRLASRTVGTWLLLYELFVFLLLAGVFIYINLEPVAGLLKDASPLSPVDLVQFFNTLIWGGLGGIVGAFYALWKHIASEQDFDPQYYLWYLTNPILGIALGAFIFLVFQAGFFSLTAGSEEGITIRSALVIYVFAWVSGFKQNVVYDIVRRILDVFRVELGRNGKEKQSGGDSSGTS
jgi:hypothetical protein